VSILSPKKQDQSDLNTLYDQVFGQAGDVMEAERRYSQRYQEFQRPTNIIDQILAPKEPEIPREDVEKNQIAMERPDLYPDYSKWRKEGLTHEAAMSLADFNVQKSTEKGVSGFKPLLGMKAAVSGFPETAASHLRGATVGLGKPLSPEVQEQLGITPEQAESFSDKYIDPALLKAADWLDNLPNELSEKDYAEMNKAMGASLIPKKFNLEEISKSFNKLQVLLGRNLATLLSAKVAGKAYGPLGGILVMGSQETGNFVKNANETGIDKDITEKWAERYGAVAGPVEYLQQAWLFSRFGKTKPEREIAKKVFSESLKKLMISKAGRVIAELLGASVEGLEEVIQGGTQTWMMNKAIDEMRERHGLSEEELPYQSTDLKEEFLAGAALGLVHAGAGGAVRSVANRVSNAAKNVRSKPIENITEEDLNEINEAISEKMKLHEEKPLSEHEQWWMENVSTLEKLHKVRASEEGRQAVLEALAEMEKKGLGEEDALRIRGDEAEIQEGVRERGVLAGEGIEEGEDQGGENIQRPEKTRPEASDKELRLEEKSTKTKWPSNLQRFIDEESKQLREKSDIEELQNNPEKYLKNRIKTNKLILEIDYFKNDKEMITTARENIKQSEQLLKELKTEKTEAKEISIEEVATEKIEKPLFEKKIFKHSQTGEDKHVITLGKRIDKDQFKALSQRARSLGGYYSKYKQQGAIPGFIFKTEQDAEKFIEGRWGEGKKPMTYQHLVRNYGGLKSEGDLAGEVKRLPLWVRRGDGLTLDQMWERLKEDGYPVESVNDLINKLMAKEELPATGKQVKETEEKAREKEVEDFEKFEPVEMTAGEIAKKGVGAKVKIRGEDYEVKKAEPGEIVLEDGTRYELDEFDKITVDRGEIIPAEKAKVLFKPGVKEAIKKHDLEYIGVQKGIAELPDLLMFNDPEAKGTTFGVPTGSTVEVLEKRMNEAREGFKEKPKKEEPQIVKFKSEMKKDKFGESYPYKLPGFGESYPYNLPEGDYQFRIEPKKTGKGYNLIPIDENGEPVQVKTVHGDSIDKIGITQQMYERDLEKQIKEQPAKEPWEMTWKDYFDQNAYFYHKDTGEKIRNAIPEDQLKARHRLSIKKRIRAGKPVPAEVLKDYPELKEKKSLLVDGHKRDNQGGGYEDVEIPIGVARNIVARHGGGWVSTKKLELPDDIKKVFKYVSIKDKDYPKLQPKKLTTQKVPGAKHEQIVSPELLGQAKMPTGKIKKETKPVVGREGVGMFKTKELKTGDLFKAQEKVSFYDKNDALRTGTFVRKIEKGKNKGHVVVEYEGTEKTIAPEKVRMYGGGPSAKEVVAATKKAITPIAKVVEPAKLVEWKHGSKVAADVIKAFHHAQAQQVEFSDRAISKSDKTFGDVEQYLNKNFSNAELDNFMLTRGDPTDIEGIDLQKEATHKVSPEMRNVYERTMAVTQEAADIAYGKLLRYAEETGKGDGLTADEMTEINLFYVNDYFRGVYKNNDAYRDYIRDVKKRLQDHFRNSTSFLHPKTFGTYADAKAIYGLELKNPNPITNIKSEIGTIERIRANTWLRETLLEDGKDKYVMRQTPKKKRPAGWKLIGAEGDPVWNNIWAEPDLARLINSLLSINKITTNKTGRFFWSMNNYLRAFKFLFSAFHQMSVTKQAFADNGWFGFMNPKKFTGTVRDAVRITKDAHSKVIKDPTIKRAYQHYIRLGGTPIGGEGHFEIERAAVRQIEKLFEKTGTMKVFKTKLGRAAFKVPQLPFNYVSWLFRWYIPQLKFQAYMKDIARRETKLKRNLTDAELIDTIKEGQNFYGEMNERLFGRSGTTTTLMRFIWMAPGYAEGNYRTNIKALAQWGKGGPGDRSRQNVVNSLIISATLATIGTLIFTKKSPKKPETVEDIRDLFKVNTGLKDDKDRDIMIDMLTYDKDYWQIWGNLFTGQADKIPSGVLDRVGGMNSTLLQVATDMGELMQGKAVIDWKNDVVVDVPLDMQEIMKFVNYELTRMAPISTSTFQQSRRRGANAALAFAMSALGVRTTVTEEEKRRREHWEKFYKLRNNRDELFRYLTTINDPIKNVEEYNKQINKFVEKESVPKEVRDAGRKLLINIKRYLWRQKMIASGRHKATHQQRERAKRIIENFEKK